MKHLPIFLLVAVLVVIAVLPFMGLRGYGASAYDRVTSAGLIRCGWAPAYPLIYANPDTGEIVGPMADIAREMARSLELNIEWIESDWGAIGKELDARKIDAMCTGLWTAPPRAKQMLFTRPLSYSMIFPIIRADDNRFANGLAVFNQPHITIAIKEGTISDFLSRRYFPKAKRLVVKGKGGIADDLPFIEVASGRADVTLFSPDIFAFDRTNPGKLKALTEHGPVEVFGNVFAVGRGQDDLRDMMNSALEQLLLNRRVQAAMEKSGLLEKTFRLAEPEFGWKKP